MAQAIAAANGSAASTTGATGSSASPSAAAALQAQLDRYQKELADCVNCSSAKTEAGKQNIQDISGKISDLKARIDQESNAKPAGAQTSTAQDNSSQSGAAASPDGQNVATGAPRPGAANLTLGGFLDVHI